MGAPRKILFSAVKNEAPFLVEWIAYHRAIGFDRVVIVSNDSDDGTTELLDALAGLGAIQHIHHSVAPGQSPQGRAAEAANASGLIGDGDWLIWLDADEFLNIHAGQGMVDDLIAAMGDAVAMLIPWRIFGDGRTDPGPPWHFISPDFIRAARPGLALNHSVKTFYRHDRNLARPSHKSPHRPRLNRQHPLAPKDVINADGHPMDITHDVGRRWLEGIDSSANSTVPDSDGGWDLAQINHYSVRTRDLFDLKKQRGRGYQGKRSRPGRIRHSDRFFAKHNRNEAEDRTILRHLGPTRAGIERLLACDSVRLAHEAGLQRTKARIAARESAAASGAASGEASGAASGAASAAAPAARTDAAPSPLTPDISMPRAEADFLRAAYGRHDVILEYGTGGSTRFAASQPHSLIMGVESDPDWADRLAAGIRRDFPDARLHLHWADIGPVRKWGFPADDRAWRRYHLYPQSVWDQPWFRHPDLVLIDGRFRVGCLLTTLFRITRPVTVLFDDYTPRPQYAAMIGGLAEPEQIIGRMAVFRLAPAPIPAARLRDIIACMADPA